MSAAIAAVAASTSVGVSRNLWLILIHIDIAESDRLLRQQPRTSEARRRLAPRNLTVRRNLGGIANESRDYRVTRLRMHDCVRHERPNAGSNQGSAGGQSGALSMLSSR